MTEAEPWVSIDDVAAHLGVRKDSVYRWIEQRGLPATKIGKLWKLKLSEVDAWMRAHRPTEPSEPAELPPGGTRAGGFREHLVLVIDDEEMVRETLADFLADEGYRALLATDGDEALRLLASTTPRPSLIILDLKMPNLDGWEFRRRQAQDPALASIPVIVVTATQGDGHGAAAVLRKPLRLAHLAEAMNTILASSPRGP